MAKYGRAKYGISKYGRYDIEIPGGVDLSQLKRYRLRIVSPSGEPNSAIVNTSVQFPSGGPLKVRLRSDKSGWVHQRTETISGDMIRIRIKSVGSTESKWVMSVVGTIRNKQA